MMADHTASQLEGTNEICLYCYNELSSDYQSQLCLLPSYLFATRGWKVNSVLELNDNNDARVICRVMPVYTSLNLVNFQGLLACNVLSGITDITKFLFNKQIKCCLNDVVLLKEREALSVKVTFIMNSVGSALNYRRTGNSFLNEYTRLLSMYAFTCDSIINCSSNPLSKLLGISYIIINNIIFQDKVNIDNRCVGKVSTSTKIEVLHCESIDRLKHSIGEKITLGGLDDILQKLCRIVLEPWTMKQEFQMHNIHYCKGALLVGPPGCGKTSLVKELCAKTGASCISTSDSEFRCLNGEKTIASFLKVQKKACQLSIEGPCVFFIDEIDSFCPLRTKESSVHEIWLTAQIFLALEECKKYPHLVVIGATNRPFALDPAIRRSGHLELEILLNVPTEVERRAILSVHVRDLLPQNHPAISKVSLITPGFVGADLSLMCEKIRKSIAEDKGPNLKSEDDIAKHLMQLASSLTPSIRKTLEFVTTNPSASPVGGLDHIKCQLQKVFFQHSKYSKLFAKYNIKRPKGVLLYGPRGCGKTRLVSELASKQGCTFISANASHLLSPFVGDSEKRVAALFHSARITQPSIVFIDEIDGIFGVREERLSGVRASLLTELLQAMDGADVGGGSLQGARFMNNKVESIETGILICAATNNPERLDSALIRPGRFDKLVYVPPPDRKARLEILQLKTSKVKFEGSNVLDDIADKTEGWTGAELENLTSKMAMKAVLEDPRPTDIYIPNIIVSKCLENAKSYLTPKELKKFEKLKY